MEQGDSVSFLIDVRKLFGDCQRKLLKSVDGVSGVKNVAQMRKQKYSGIINRVEDINFERSFFYSIIDRLPKGPN